MSRDEAGRARVIAFVAVAGLLGVLLVFYTVRHRRPPIPADLDHRSEQQADGCLRCHGPGRPAARGPNHPLNDRCFECHERT